MSAPAPNERGLPLSARNDPERAKAFGDLHEGVPAWLKESMLDWIKRRCGDLPQVYLRGDLRDPIQLELRVSLPMRLSQLPTEMYLDVIDYRLRHYRRTRFNVPIHEDLEDILKKGGSAWRATERGLERQVEETLQATAESIFEAGDHPASYLRDAWHKAWGRNPDASGPYREAVRAVETAYAPIVSPKNDPATLGTIIADITGLVMPLYSRL